MTHDMAYVALVSQDVEATASVFERQLELPKQNIQSSATGLDVPVFTIGKTALAIFPVGDPMVDEAERPGVHHIALASSDIDSSRQHLAKVGLHLMPEGRPGLNGHLVYKLPKSSTDGVDLRVTNSLELKPHKSGPIERIDHLGVACVDVRKSEKIFSNQLGYEVESRQTDMEVSMAIESFTSDKYGVVYHNRKPVPLGGLRVCFITVGDCELEFLANFDPNQEAEVAHGQPGNTKGDQGAITKFVQTRGAGLHHIALKTVDINSTLARLNSAGVQMIDLKGRPGSRRALIGFAHPKGMGGILLHLCERP
jgi:methylmalonyl-CoA/ethylmalonyl-CoA epimerase